MKNARAVDGFVAEVAAASQQQSEGPAQINTAVAQLDKVTQSDAATAEETASAAEELNAQAAELQQAAAQLALLVGSTKTALATTAHDQARPARHATSSTVAKKSKAPAPRAPRHEPAPPLAAATPVKLTAEPALSFGE